MSDSLCEIKMRFADRRLSHGKVNLGAIFLFRKDWSSCCEEKTHDSKHQ